MNLSGPYAGLLVGAWRNLRRIARLRSEVVHFRPDCIVAFSESQGVNSILASIGTGVPVLVSEHSNPHFFLTTRHGRVWHFLRCLVYRYAAAIVVLTEFNRQFFPGKIREKTVVIPNAVPTELDTDDHSAEPPMSLPPPTIAALGRLEPEKRFDLLIKAFARVVQHVDCRLVIVGDGTLRAELAGLSEQLGLADRVIMPGFLRHPWRLLRHASLFVLSSEVEVFPMVLLEAMSYGLPVVSFDCRTGPAEIIRDGVDGVLVPPLDVEALARAMVRLLKDDEERKRMSFHSVAVRERFSTETMIASWEDLLMNATHNRRPVRT